MLFYKESTQNSFSVGGVSLAII